MGHSKPTRPAAPSGHLPGGRPVSGPLGRTAQAILPLAFWLLVWHLAALAVGKPLLLPGPWATAQALARLAPTGEFWQITLTSLGRIVLGFLEGVVVGSALAALTAALPPADWIFSPAIRLVRAVPVPSFILLVLLWVPTGRVSVLIAGLMVLPVLWGAVRQGIGSVDPLLLEAARAYRFSRGKQVRLVYLPTLLPHFAGGCRTALGLAWKAGVAAEVLCVPRVGIGTQVYYAKLYLETESLFAWTAVVAVLSLGLEKGLDLLLGHLERRGGHG